MVTKKNSCHRRPGIGGGGGALPVVLSDVDCLEGSVGGSVFSAACG